MYGLFEDITIYHQNENKQWIRYTKKASVRNTSIRNRTTTGLTNVDSTLIRIFDVDGYNNTYFIKKGDVIVRGNVEDNVKNAPVTELRSKYGEENVYQVKSIDIFKFDDNITKELQHIKVGAI